VNRRFRACVALLSIALLATDLVVAAWGHRHDHAPAADGHACGARSQACSQHSHAHSHCREHASADDEHQGGQSPGHSSDDCSICRHFSQPVAPVAMELPQLVSGNSAPLVCLIIERTGTCLAAEHLARGPPALCA
jgi:hypothetical protein